MLTEFVDLIDGNLELSFYSSMAGHFQNDDIWLHATTSQ